MFACCNRAASLTSRVNRSADMPSSMLVDTTLMTTARPRSVSVAWKTRDIPPPPSSRSMRYLFASAAFSRSLTLSTPKDDGATATPRGADPVPAFDSAEGKPHDGGSMMRLLTFGGLALKSGDGSSPRLRPQRLAILAVLAAGEHGVSRERLYSIFWPEADEEHARASLRQALYALRQELGEDVVESDAALTLDRARVASDVADFRSALASGARSQAAQLATGPFLDGFFLPGAAGFERWVEDERAALTADATRALLSLAREAEASGDPDAALDWWRRLTRIDPLSGRFALGFLRALAARGDRAGALAFARAHESVVRRELEADPDPEIRRLEAELRAIPSPPVTRSAPPIAPITGRDDPVQPNDQVAAGASRPVEATTPAWKRRRVLVGAGSAVAGL